MVSQARTLSVEIWAPWSSKGNSYLFDILQSFWREGLVFLIAGELEHSGALMAILRAKQYNTSGGFKKHRCSVGGKKISPVISFRAKTA